MKYEDKTREELIDELMKLRKELEALTISNNQNITLRIQAVEAYRQSEERLLAKSDNLMDLASSRDEAIQEDAMRLELAIDSVDMAWWNMDIPTGAVIFHKRKAEMLGYPAEKFLHYKDFTDLVHPEDYEGAMKAMRDHFAGVAKTYDTEYRIMSNSGEYKWFYDIGSVVKRDPFGAPLKIVGFVIDITKQKSSEAEIIRKNQELNLINAEKDKFFSIIAHDLRSPFNSLLGFTQMMDEEFETMSQEKAKKIIRLMRTSATNLYRLLENLLEWSRLQRSLTTLNRLSFLLLPGIKSSIELARETAQKKEIEIICHIPEDLMVFADERMVEGILRNLSTNAVKFTPRGGKITITAKSVKDNAVEFSVRDTGIGIGKKMMDELFRIDVNTSRPGTENEPSKGLGLILCKEFVDKHGGRIWVESEEGKGSTFYFTLPGKKTSELNNDLA